MKRKKSYKKPTMEEMIFHEPELLAGSGGLAAPSTFEEGEDPFADATFASRKSLFEDNEDEEDSLDF